MSSNNYVLGVDYGTDSVRTILVRTSDGEVLASDVFNYPRWKKGFYCDPAKNQFRQHPLDYLEGLEATVKNVITSSGINTADIKGLGVDTTGSTPVPVDRQGTPLSLKNGFDENPNAMFNLWKDHTAVKEAEEINTKAKNWGGIDYTKYEGGVYSSEWFWAKIMHVIRHDEEIFRNAYSWVEHCDWIPAILTGITDPLKMKRSRCAAGHKAMWHESWEGLPEEDFLEHLDPKLKGLKEKLYKDTYTSDIPAGNLCQKWAEKLGLHTGVVVTVGTFDAHSGALGGEVEEYTLSKVMGTSTCDMLVAPMDKFGDRLVGGICGQVDGSIVPGMLGLEAGQSAFGDIYAWFSQLLQWPEENLLHDVPGLDKNTIAKIREHIQNNLIAKLSEEAEKIPVDESGIVALDWMNGRRTPWADQSLKGALMGLSLGSDAPRIFRALVEATCFGSKMIVDRFRDNGIEIRNVVALGGVAKKSSFVMQVMSDILNLPIKVVRSEQTPALGAAMLASVASGIYPDTHEAQNNMGSGFDREYTPDTNNAGRYEKLYERYKQFGEFVEKETHQHG